MAVINIRVNDEVKKEAESIFKSLGLNMSVAMNLFLKKCINENDLEKRINKFMEYSVNYSRLTPYEC